MTAQVPDRIRIGNNPSQALFTNPLESWRKLGLPHPKFKSESTALWRGYIATWRIADDRLWLEGLQNYSLDVFFANDPDRSVNADGRVLADWYSGELRMPEGEQTEYVHMGYASRFERDRIITVQGGRVVLVELVDEAADRLVFYDVVRESLRTFCTDDEWPFVEQILDDPIDALRRNIFADWLEDRDDVRAAVIRLVETPEQRRQTERARVVHRFEQLNEQFEQQNTANSVVKHVVHYLSAEARKPERMYEHLDRIRQLNPQDRLLLRCLGLLPCEHLIWSWQGARLR